MRTLFLAFIAATAPFLIQSDHWCHEQGSDNLLEDDFTAALVLLYGNSDNCTITREGLDAFAADLGIGEAHVETHGISLLHKSRKFREKLRSYSSVSTRNFQIPVEQKFHPAPVTSQNDTVDVTHTCYSVDELLEIFNLTKDVTQGLSQQQFENLCPALLQQSLQGCLSHDHPSASSPSDLEMYGLGTLAVFVISISSLFGLVVHRWRDTDVYQYIICTMLGLAVGALVGDAALHLAIEALGLHSDHEGESHGEEIVIEDYVWKMVLCLASVWGFFILQMGLEYANTKSGHGHSHGPVRLKNIEKGENNQAFTISKGDIADSSSKYVASDDSKHPQQVDHNYNQENATIKNKTVAWMVVVGDSVHNFADGITIGASFAVDWQTGLATSIAVLCHEIPHEFGDIAALLASGWPVKKVVLVNFVSACVSFVGLFVGIPVASALDAESWILGAALGMFLYVGLANILPELMENFKQNPSLKLALASNLGIFLGFLIMFLMAVFEEQIRF